MFDGLIANYMTAQEVWSKVANHLMQQGRVCYTQHNGCAYHDEVTGMKCAVGILIPENEYTPNCEGQPIYSLRTKHFCPPTLKALMDQHGLLLSELQRIHDNSAGENYIPEHLRKVWFIALRNLGRSVGLDTTEFETRWKRELGLTY